MKTIVIEAATCPSCGKLMPAGALAGFCPACLLAQGAETDGGEGGHRGRFVPPPLEEVAKLFPQLEILGLLGAGGMGAVYKARQPALDRIVALKILPASGAEGANFEERFNREARALARLNHPNIVAVFEFGRTPPQTPHALTHPLPSLHFFIMEFVDGANLRQLEQAGRLAPREALQIIPQICDALQYAHDEGVVHRDIKPENVLVDRKGRVKIADFGLAKILGHDPDAARLTAEGQVMGTPHYMAPEQVEKPLTVDHRADIYSLGVVFYEMLTGDLPLGKFSPPSRKFQLDVRLDDVVLRALENDPARRYQHASEVKTQVENIAGTPAPAASSGPSAPEQKFIRWMGFPVVVERNGVRKENWKGELQAVAILFGVITIGCGIVSLIAGGSNDWLGIVRWKSVVARLVFVAVVVAFGARRALRPKPAQDTPPQTPPGTVISTPERFSRKALLGVCWVPFAFFAFFGSYLVHSVQSGTTHHGPHWWQILLAVLTLPLGFSAPFGTTLLGWLAVADVRRARGRISGLPLAVFDGLFFPLLALDGVLIWAWMNVVEMLHRREVFDAFHAGEVSVLTKIGAAAICVLVNLFIIRRVWRAVRLDGSAPRAGGDWWWSRRPGVVVIGLACVGLIAANIWRLEKSSPRVAVQQRITAPDAQTGTFLAKLPERGTVELLAVSDAGAAPNEWWLPNGTPIPDTLYEFAQIGNVNFNNWTNKDFVLRWRDLPSGADGPYVEFDPSGASSSGGKSWRDGKKFWGTWPVRTAFPPTATEATMRVGFDFATWQTVCTHDRNGNGNFPKTPPGVPNLHAQVHRVGENNGQAFVTLSLAQESRDWKTRVIAVDTNGVEHADHLGTATPADKNAVLTYDFLQLPLARVREFRVQVRPVHWVEFRGVALKPRKPSAPMPAKLAFTPSTIAPKISPRKDPYAAKDPEAKLVFSGTPAQLEEAPQLRFLAWQDEWKTNQPHVAWRADGSLVTEQAELDLLRQLPIASMDVSATEAGKRDPRFLHLWLSHPLFHLQGLNEVTLLDDSGLPIRLAGEGATSSAPHSGRPPKDNLNWLLCALSPGEGNQVPARVTVRLRYVVGPLENPQDVAVNFNGGMSLENGQLNGIGQDADGRTFVALAADTRKQMTRHPGITAVTHDRRELSANGHSTMGPVDGTYRAERFYFNTPLSEITRFRIGSRAVRTMEWTNVVLKTPPLH